MKKYFLIVWLLSQAIAANAQQVQIQMDDQAFLLPLNGMGVTACKSLCKPEVQQGWTVVRGSCTLSSAVADSVWMSNFVPGYTSIAFFCIDTSGQRYADTLTVQFLQPPPCPPCPVCPPNRTVTGMSWMTDAGRWQFTFSYGLPQIF